MKATATVRPYTGRIAIALACLLIVLFPLVVQERYYLHIAILIFIYITLVQSWNLPGGFAGYISFGHVLFFGMGGYTVGILMNFLNVGPTWAILAAGGVAIVLALLFGSISLRLRGVYFAIATLAVAIIGKLVIGNIDVLGGAEGMLLPLSPWSIEFEKIPFYYAAAGTAAAATLTMVLIRRSNLGFRLLALKDDEDKAEASGINTTKHKVIAFIISAFFPGIIGGLHAYYIGYINPAANFSILYSANVLVMAAFGGIGTIGGPIIGATTFVALSEILSYSVGSQFRLGIYGLILVLVTIFLPRGVISLRETLRSRRRAPREQLEATTSERGD